jgi:GntR family transcriptional regulator/MocR family aminotransferase
VTIRTILDGKGALYQQIYRSIREDILSGRLKRGERLPSVRELASDFGASRMVIQDSLECLAADGFVYSSPGRGVFVSDNLDGAGPHGGSRPASARVESPLDQSALSEFAMRALSASPADAFYKRLSARAPIFDFAYWMPATTDSFRAKWVQAAAAAAKLIGASYPDPHGEPLLRQEIAKYVCRARDVFCEPEDVVVCSGAQQAFDLISRCFKGEGGAVAFEEPGYFNARRSFEANGFAIAPIGVDDKGLQTFLLDEMAPRNARLLYATPSHQMPVGGILPLERRRELLDWAERRSAYIIEDDYDGEFRFAAKYVPSLKSMDEKGRVFYVGTFSKTILPSLRLAYVVPPKQLLGAFVNAKMIIDHGASSFVQTAAALFLESGAFAQHLAAVKRIYAERRDLLIESLSARIPEARLIDSGAGLHVHLYLGEAFRGKIGPLLSALSQKSILLSDPRDYYMDPANCDSLILGYAQIHPELIDEGVAHIAAQLQMMKAAA